MNADDFYAEIATLREQVETQSEDIKRLLTAVARCVELITKQGEALSAMEPSKEMQVVKSLCWRWPDGSLIWGNEGIVLPWVRFPAGDIEGEVKV